MSFLYIQSNDELEQFCARQRGCGWLAVDTEFVREKTYYPELALIQVGSAQEMACIDPYEISEFQPLMDLFADTSVVKIFHSPSQDLELFAYKFGALPTPVFDTQLAASVLGMGNQIGYAALVQQLTGARLSKQHTRTDWSRRPLSDAVLDYAIDDVRYLGDMYEQLLADLTRRDRLSWVQHDFQRMSDLEHYRVHPETLWKKLKGIQKLKGRALCLADQLCQWRERKAEEANRPRRWILKDEDVIDLAKMKPTELSQFKAIRTLSEGFIQRQGKEIIALLEKASEIDRSLWPQHDEFKNLSSAQAAIVDCLMAICRLRAESNDISLASLATKKDLDKLVLGQDSKLLEGWRFEVAGRDCQGFLKGEGGIAVIDGELVLVTD